MDRTVEILWRFAMAPFVLLRLFVLPILVLAPFYIGWDLGRDLWSDFKERKTAYNPAPDVRVSSFSCPGPTCIIVFDGGLSAIGRNRLSYSLVSGISANEVELVRSTADGSITAKFARDRLMERLFVLIGLELFLFGTIVVFTWYLRRSILFLLSRPQLSAPSENIKGEDPSQR